MLLPFATTLPQEMAAEVLDSMQLEPAKRDPREAIPTGGMVTVCPHGCSLEIVENLEPLTNLHVILVQGLC